MCQASTNFVKLRCSCCEKKSILNGYNPVIIAPTNSLLASLDLTNYFERNAFANGETTQFLNAALVNNPMLKQPANGAGITLRWDAGHDLGFSLGAQTSHDFVEDLLSEPFVIGEIDYHTTCLIDGNYRLWLRVSSLETDHDRQTSR